VARICCSEKISDFCREARLWDERRLPPPEVIAQDIVDDLEAAPEQFRLIAGDLDVDAERGLTFDVRG
jgi:hypothetical protein